MFWKNKAEPTSPQARQLTVIFCALSFCRSLFGQRVQFLGLCGFAKGGCVEWGQTSNAFQTDFNNISNCLSTATVFLATQPHCWIRAPSMVLPAAVLLHARLAERFSNPRKLTTTADQNNLNSGLLTKFEGCLNFTPRQQSILFKTTIPSRMMVLTLPLIKSFINILIH